MSLGPSRESIQEWQRNEIFHIKFKIERGEKSELSFKDVRLLINFGEFEFLKEHLNKFHSLKFLEEKDILAVRSWLINDLMEGKNWGERCGGVEVALAHRGLLTGDPEGKFSPEHFITAVKAGYSHIAFGNLDAFEVPYEKEDRLEMLCAFLESREVIDGGTPISNLINKEAATKCLFLSPSEAFLLGKFMQRLESERKTRRRNQ